MSYCKNVIFLHYSQNWNIYPVGSFYCRLLRYTAFHDHKLLKSKFERSMLRRSSFRYNSNRY